MGLRRWWSSRGARSVLLPAEDETQLRALRREQQAAFERLGEQFAGLQLQLAGREPAALETLVRDELEALRKELRQEGRTRLKQTAATETALETLRQSLAERSSLIRSAGEIAQALEQSLLDRWTPELLASLDALEAGVRQLRSAPAGALEDYAQGFEMARARLLGLLRGLGVEPIDDGIGRPLDPAVQRAIGTREISDAAPGTVLELVRRGYRQQGRVLRSAEAIVARAPTEPATNEGDVQ